MIVSHALLFGGTMVAIFPIAVTCSSVALDCFQVDGDSTQPFCHLSGGPSTSGNDEDEGSRLTPPPSLFARVSFFLHAEEKSRHKIPERSSGAPVFGTAESATSPFGNPDMNEPLLETECCRCYSFLFWLLSSPFVFFLLLIC